jgi:methylenetetrahydrofolate reductase (NADPH)
LGDMQMDHVALSFEFFPPKTDDQRELLHKSVPKLVRFAPEYVSVTFGAGGSTLDYTVDAVSMLKSQYALNAAPHLSCMGGTRAEIKRLLDTYVEMGCKRIVALRGDMPSGMASSGDFSYAAELVSYIRREHGDHFHIEVGAYPEFHPQAESADADLTHFVDKINAGADGAITQYFFNADAYFHFLDDVTARGVSVPIVPGIMPIGNFSQLKRFSDMCGTEIPRWLSKRMLGFGDDAQSVRDFGADVVAELCDQLVGGGVEALHFYTLNRAKATLEVLDRLGVKPKVPG